MRAAASILVAGLIASAGAAFAAPEPSTRITPEHPKLGEPFTYEVTFKHASAQRYELLSPKSWGAFTLLGQARQRADGATGSRTTFRFRLAVFELDARELPTLTFKISGAGNGQDTAVAPGRTVEPAATVTAKDPAQLLDAAPPVERTVRSYRVMGVAGAALLALLALGFALRTFLQRRRPPEPLDVRTRAALRRLEAERLPERGDEREFHFRLSEIVRSYLGERFGLEARECTSTELMLRVRSLNEAGLPQDELAAFLRSADLVKFAKASAESGECEAALRFGHRLVDLTPPKALEAPHV